MQDFQVKCTLVSKHLENNGVIVNDEWLKQGLEYLHRNGFNFKSLPIPAIAERVFQDLFLYCDIRDSCRSNGILPPNPTTLHKRILGSPETPLILQISEAINVGSSLENRMEPSCGNGRTFKLLLTDGKQKIYAIETEIIRQLYPAIPAGTKLSVLGAIARRGVLMLSPRCCVILGGGVESLQNIQHSHNPAIKSAGSVPASSSIATLGSITPSRPALPAPSRVIAQPPLAAVQLHRKDDDNDDLTTRHTGLAPVHSLPPAFSQPLFPRSLAAPVLLTSHIPQPVVQYDNAPLPAANSHITHTKKSSTSDLGTSIGDAAGMVPSSSVRMCAVIDLRDEPFTEAHADYASCHPKNSAGTASSWTAAPDMHKGLQDMGVEMVEPTDDLVLTPPPLDDVEILSSNMKSYDALSIPSLPSPELQDVQFISSLSPVLGPGQAHSPHFIPALRAPPPQASELPITYPQVVTICPLELLLPHTNGTPIGSDALSAYTARDGRIRVCGMAIGMKKFKIIDVPAPASGAGPTGSSGTAKAYDVRAFLDDGKVQLEVALASRLVEKYLGVSAAAAHALFSTPEKETKRAEMCIRFETFAGVFWARRGPAKGKGKAGRFLTVIEDWAEDIAALCARMLLDRQRSEIG